MSDFDPASVPISKGHFIGGRLIANAPDTYVVQRPSDGQDYADLPDADADIVDFAVANAEKSRRQSGWSRCAPRDRARALRRWADLIAEHKQRLGRIEALGSTRPIREVIEGDVLTSAEALRFFAEYADKLGGEIAATQDDRMGMIISEPYGVLGAIVPWNFPVSMAVWKAGPALAAGNAIVLKPSELTPFSAVALAELALDAGIPPGVFNVVQGRGATAGAALCSNPGVGKLSFTGSSQTGSKIMGMIADSGTRPVTLELGGKSPQLVFADAPDMSKVADCVAASLLANAGQACVAGSRLIVEQSACDVLVEKVLSRIRNITPGHTWRGRTDFSPIVSQNQLRKIERVVDASRHQGAEILAGGRRLEQTDGGAFYEPTLISRVEADSPALLEEIFGPVLTVQTFIDDEEGLALADHPTFGLAAGVYTANLGRALRATRQLQAGTVWVNRYSRTRDFNLPTGGYKGSGFGKDLGRHAVEACLRHKSVLIDISP